MLDFFSLVLGECLICSIAILKSEIEDKQEMSFCGKYYLQMNEDASLPPSSHTSTFPSHMMWSQPYSWTAFPFRSIFHPALIQLLLIHAIQILLSLKPISYAHYIYIICTKSTTKAKGMLYVRLQILWFTEVLPLGNFSFHLFWWLLKTFTWGYICRDKILR